MIRHVLKDGRVLRDIKGHLVTKKDAPMSYDILEKRMRGETNGDNLRKNQRSK